MGINSVKKQFVKLNLIERRELLEELLRLQERDGLVLQEAAVEVEKKREMKPCPHCGSEKVYKRGKQKGIQIYKYRESECSSWFSETTGTALYNIQLKEKWQSYLSCMEQGIPINKIVKKLEISIQTSFDWRHEVLSSLEHYIPKELNQIIECDELEFPVSEKGNQSGLPSRFVTKFLKPL